ncbi:MAG: hypothetical protein JO142_02155 [Burkholderiales bacterium]|nr:hypothetical protein [Burkholderiales bacterium]
MTTTTIYRAGRACATSARCSKCKQTKPADDFPRNSSRPSGLAAECKNCRKQYNATANAQRPKASGARHVWDDYKAPRKRDLYDEMHIAEAIDGESSIPHEEPSDRVFVNFDNLDTAFADLQADYPGMYDYDN